jgi:glycosyltransferase involved in cell wall biosynthesis
MDGKSEIQPLSVSICLATYEMGGYGARLFTECLEKIQAQTYQPIEILVGDHSNDDEVERAAKKWATSSSLPITYIRHFRGRGSSSYNLNRLARLASGDLIVYLFQDDHFIENRAIELAAATIFNSNAKWGKMALVHTSDGVEFGRYLRPKITPELLNGVNTLSNQSGLFILRGMKLDFDETLNWYVDCDIFLRLFLTYGYPCIIEQPCIAIRSHPVAVTNNPPVKQVLDNELSVFQQKILKEFPTYKEWKESNQGTFK